MIEAVEAIRLEIEGRSARLVLDRPRVLNAGNRRWVADLNEAVAAHRRRAVRARRGDHRRRPRVLHGRRPHGAGGRRVRPRGLHRVGGRDDRHRADGPTLRGWDQRALPGRRSAAGPRVRLPPGQRGRAARAAGRQGVPDSFAGALPAAPPHRRGPGQGADPASASRSTRARPSDTTWSTGSCRPPSSRARSTRRSSASWPCPRQCPGEQAAHRSRVRPRSRRLPEGRCRPTSQVCLGSDEHRQAMDAIRARRRV